MARLLHGRPLADAINSSTKERSTALSGRGVTPRLAIVSVGADPAASAYTQRLVRAGAAVGVVADDIALGRDADEQRLRSRLDELAVDGAYHGVLLMTPLPKDFDRAVFEHISIDKDVEGMHPFNIGRIAVARPMFAPSTAEAVVELLKHYEIPLAGSHVVVIGRSSVVGRPAAYLLLGENATVTIAHRHTREVERLSRQADIVVVAVGQAGFLKAEMVREGAVVIDAGTNATPGGLVGDADAAVMQVAGAMSPVPGGLGAVTVALLLRNVLTAAERRATM